MNIYIVKLSCKKIVYQLEIMSDVAFKYFDEQWCQNELVKKV